MGKVYFITYDLTARGGISYYARALIPALKKKEPDLVIIELKQKNRWHRLASLLVCAIYLKEIEHHQQLKHLLPDKNE